MSSIRKIAKNLGVLFVAQMITYVMGFFITMYTARYLGAAGFGILSLALSITGIFGVFGDLGLSTLMIRDIARDKSITNKYMTNFAIIKVALVCLMFGLIALTVNIIGYSKVVDTVIYLITLSVALNSFGGVLTAVFQANEKMEYLSVNYVINSTLMLVGTAIGIYYQLDVIFFALLYVISTGLVLIPTFLIYVWKFSWPKIEVDLSLWKPSIKEAWPFGITGLLVNIYYWIDSVILSIMVGTEVVGWYNAAYKLIVVILFIPTVLNVVVFPIMSKLYVTSKDSLKLVYEKYFKYMAILGIPIGVGTTLLADKIILLIFGNQYIPSIIALQILIWSSVILFMSGAFSRLLEASNQQLVLTKITAICAVLNIVLNVILIPKYSFIGASFVTVVTELASFVLTLRITSSKGYGLTKKEGSDLLKIIFASAVMAAFLICFRSLNLFVLIVLASIIYFIILFLVKGIDEEDKRIFEEAINNK